MRNCGAGGGKGEEVETGARRAREKEPEAGARATKRDGGRQDKKR